MQTPRYVPVPEQKPIGNSQESYTKEFAATLWPRADALDFFGPSADLNAIWENERWLAERQGRPMRLIDEMRVYRDKRLARQELDRLAAVERIRNAHFDQGSRLLGPVGHGVGTGVVKGAGDIANGITWGLLSPLLDQIVESVVADATCVKERAGVTPGPYADYVVDKLKSVPGTLYGNKRLCLDPIKKRVWSRDR